KSNDSYFNKDAIRESHIWKNVEWGKREKNYSPGGKDPSNVWIPTEDDGKGKIIKHIALKLEVAVDRLFNAFNNPEEIENSWYYYNFSNISLENKENLKFLLRSTSNNFLDNVVQERRNIPNSLPGNFASTSMV